MTRWDEAAVNRRRVEAKRGMETDGDGALIFDGTDFPKKGKHSVGVARQYSGSLGKIANCQVTVNCHYAERTIGWPVGTRLYLPKDWTDDRERCEEVYVPDDVGFQTKAEIALGLLDQANGMGVRHSVVTADAEFGFLEHTLGLSEIRVAAELACKKHGYILKTWLDEKALKADYDRVEVRGKLLAVPPDAYFVVNIGAGDVHFFVEFDTGTKDLKFIRRKFLAYWAYYMSGKCKTRYGTNLIRVQTVTLSDNTENKRSRLNSLRQIAGERPEHSWFWFSSLPQLQACDFLTDLIWLMPTEPNRKRLLGV